MIIFLRNSGRSSGKGGRNTELLIYPHKRKVQALGVAILVANEVAPALGQMLINVAADNVVVMWRTPHLAGI